MSTLEIIRLAVDASREADGLFINEEHGQLIIGGRFPAEAVDLWAEVAKSSAPWLHFRCVDDIDDSVDAANVRAGEKVRYFVGFEIKIGAIHLFTKEGWRSFLKKIDEYSTVSVVRLAFGTSSFETRAFSVESWLHAPAAAELHKATSDSLPRRLVRSHSPELMPPSQIEPWLLGVKPTISCPAYEEWQKNSIPRVAACLPNEIYSDDGQQKVLLAGQPPRRLLFGTDVEFSEAEFEKLQGAAAWIYREGTDAETRHTFFSSELARVWNGNRPFLDGLANRVSTALESARLTYKAHLRTGSKDTLKALADLRKTLGDEIQKIMQQTKDLSATVWRDTAVAIGAVVLKVGLDASKPGSSVGTFGFVFSAIFLYIVVSYLISIRANAEFLNVINTTRGVWRNKLYAFLDDTDYNALAEKPILDALVAYKKTEFRTRIFICFVLLVLFVLSLSEFGLFDIKGACIIFYTNFIEAIKYLEMASVWFIRHGLEETIRYIFKIK